MTEPRYSEQEFSEILRDAAERSATDQPQYSLSEIQRIAEQVDIAPEHVARAAAALPATSAERPSVLWGAASAMQLVRRVDGVVSTDQIMDTFTIARQRLGHSGETRDLGGGLEWHYDSGYSSAVVSVVPGGSGTIVRVEGRAEGRRFILYAGALAAAVLTGFFATNTATPTFSLLSAVVAFVPYAAVARAWWNRSARAMQRDLTRLADEVAARLGRG
ncbi:MAG: hypothetical protein IPP90_03640 [Gemmatimonadaceae bacterium]|nr:hypothetical protein [Gemmatimonadaceae bacterium]